MTFAEKLRHLRKGRHLTQSQLADGVGLNKKTIVMYEAGRTTPRNDRIYQRIADFLGVPVELMRVDGDEDFQDVSRAAYGADARREADRLVTDIRGLFAGGRLSRDDRDLVMKAIQEAYWDIVEDEKKG
jgi:transcriptional regulator with XRE-family HTH domain